MGLVGYWRLDNNLVDSSGNGYESVLLNDYYELGNFTYGLASNGSNYVTTNLSINFSLSYTFSCWLNINNSNSGGNDIFGSGLVQYMFYCMKIGDTQEIRIYPSESKLMDYDFSEWFLFTVVCNSSHIQPFKNGVKVGSGLSNPIYDVFDFGFINGWDINSDFYGIIDDVRVYNRSLSDSEILTLYEGYSVQVSSDVGSTVVPNGTVVIGVDQSASFVVGAKENYIPSTVYVNGIAQNSQPVTTLSGVQSNQTLYITSQYIDSEPSSISDSVSEAFEAFLFGSTWYFGILVFMLLSIGLMKLWRYTGAFIIPIIVALEVQYFQRLDASGTFIWPMVILLILAVFVGFFTITGKDKN